VVSFSMVDESKCRLCKQGLFKKTSTAGTASCRDEA
jgi:hypothetical protein